MNTHNNQEEQLAFEKARLEYCIKIFEGENKRKEVIEKRSQFYLSFITLFLGAFFLKLDFFESLNSLILQGKVYSNFVNIIYISIIILALSLIVALIAILESMRLQTYKNEYPNNFITSLFSPDSKFLEEQKTEIALLNATAISYAIAIEDNKGLNDRKAKWVKFCSLGIFSAIISLTVLLSIILYSSVL